MSSGATTRAGSRSPTGTWRQPEQADGHPDQHQRAGRAERGDVGVGQHVAEDDADDGQRALHDEHRERAGRDPPAERRGERDRREAVEGGLEVELVGAAAEAVAERAEDRERADAEQQRAGDEPLDEPLAVAPVAAPAEQPAPQPGRRTARGAASMPRREPITPPMTSEPSTMSTGALDPTASTRAGSATAVAVVAGDEQRDQPEGVGDHVAGALREPVADQDADGRPDENGR